MQRFSNWVSLPENQSARSAATRVVEGICARRARHSVNPLYLHGPAGVGKTHLARAIVQQATSCCPDLVVCSLGVDELEVASADEDDSLCSIRKADLIVLENLRFLSPGAIETVVHLIDRSQSRQRQMIVTALNGPVELNHLPARLTSRLASGLVVEIPSWSPSSRLEFLRKRCQKRGLQVDESILEWLAQRLPGSGRQLDGALRRLQILNKLQPLDIKQVESVFATDADEHRATLERISRRVCDYFQVELRSVKSEKRCVKCLHPRQVGMYLARQLTELSLDQIGTYFGGRDHSTVLHACRKVEQDLHANGSLSGVVRRLKAELH